MLCAAFRLPVRTDTPLQMVRFRIEGADQPIGDSPEGARVARVCVPCMAGQQDRVDKENEGHYRRRGSWQVEEVAPDGRSSRTAQCLKNSDCLRPGG